MAYGSYNSSNAPKYLDTGAGFWVVLTPHWRDQWGHRKHLVGSEIGGHVIGAIWRAALDDKVCGTGIGKAFVYFRKKFNAARNRWELEFISITPRQRFHTENNKHAIRVTLERT